MAVTKFLRWLLPYKDIGWAEIGEEFTRFTVIKSRWGNIYLHRLKAETPHPECHDHPWSFITLLIAGGYDELHNGKWQHRSPGNVLYRPANWSHNVVTSGISWSVVATAAKTRDWGFHPCEL